MGRDITAAIDDCCEEITGNTNWAFQDAVPKTLRNGKFYKN